MACTSQEACERLREQLGMRGTSVPVKSVTLYVLEGLAMELERLKKEQVRSSFWSALSGKYDYQVSTDLQSHGSDAVCVGKPNIGNGGSGEAIKTPPPPYPLRQLPVSCTSSFNQPTPYCLSLKILTHVVLLCTSGGTPAAAGHPSEGAAQAVHPAG